MKVCTGFLLILLSLSFPSRGQSPERLDTVINSVYNEINPVLSPDGRTLYFTRANHPANAGGKKDPGDIWLSTLGDNGWSDARRLDGPVNNRNFNAIIGFSKDGAKMYLHNQYKKGDPKFDKRGVSVAARQGDSWGFPENLPVKHFINRSGHQSASISQDEKIMLFGIESYANYGAEDIYVSFLKNGQWTDPLNLGSAINTHLQEMTPVLLKDNKTLIFASNGRGGMGSFDLFSSRRLDDSWQKWTTPVNLGSINSRGRDTYYHISPDEKYIYFVSTQNSEGYGDINRMPITPEDLAAQVEPALAAGGETDSSVLALEETEEAPGDGMIRLAGQIMSEKSGAPVNAQISFHSAQTSEVIESAGGAYTIDLPEGKYAVRVSAKGYMTIEEQVSFSGSGEGSYARNFTLSPLEVGSTFRLSSVLFHRGSTDLVDSSYAELNRVAEVMKENGGLFIELGGHTDNVGNSRLNLKLSQERVEAVKSYLVEQGIAAERITGKGYGGSKPIASNRSEETRKLNRRVEFTIIGNDESTAATE